ncbi:nucleotide exchange factor GrpE [Candidatus Gottesmanbacteria bacterium RIFCSPHIGHO2_02_FULL_39_14]|uniref:Nucleotide exchange factor GrpE n=1 Tax=Candidatus Gottesmanbacteria bacterium RIFCSPHIGHO2_02_FULL_39_14 TaxID=1798383 RepID=A0A1F5ZY73_9BACT|nr:MAG: nucleotide exchange factor GrpE [Candidatus Gottesmanbacteria bacterium RIFCSPHIGHO2_02_FULL_39_14]
MKVKSDHKNKEAEEWKNKYFRALADYQNLERRIRAEKVQGKNYAFRDMMIKLLPIIDDLVKAQMEINNEGLKLIIAKIDALLKSEHVERIDCLNKKFSADLMECVGLKEGFSEGMVTEQVRPAYLMNGEVIQTAQVIVGKEKKDDVSHPDEHRDQIIN